MDDPASRAPSQAMVEKLLKVNGLGPKLTDNIRNMAAVLCLGTLEPTEEAKNLIKSLDVPDPLPSFTEMYAKHFTASEVLDMIAFFKTPSGQKLAKVQDAFALDMFTCVQTLAANASLKVIKSEIRKQLDKLDKEDGKKTSPPPNPPGDFPPEDFEELSY